MYLWDVRPCNKLWRARSRLYGSRLLASKYSCCNMFRDVQDVRRVPPLQTQYVRWKFDNLSAKNVHQVLAKWLPSICQNLYEVWQIRRSCTEGKLDSFIHEQNTSKNRSIMPVDALQYAIWVCTTSKVFMKIYENICSILQNLKRRIRWKYSASNVNAFVKRTSVEQTSTCLKI